MTGYTMRSLIRTAMAPSPQTYRLCVESHLSPEWLAMPGVVTLAAGYDDAGWPTTSLLLEVADRAQMMGILSEMHDLNLNLLSMELVRDPDRRGCAPGPMSSGAFS
jgi:hypothetical protein